MPKEKADLDHRIREHTHNTWLGLEFQQLSESIRKLSLDIDVHGYYLDNIDSLLRDFPSEDESVCIMIKDLLKKCISPYMLKKDDKVSIIQRILSSINICIAELARQN